MSTVRVTRAKPETQLRAIMAQAVQQHRDTVGTFVPAKRRRWTYTCHDVTVVLHGESLTHRPLAEYRGPLGHWCASINKTIGKPWNAD